MIFAVKRFEIINKKGWHPFECHPNIEVNMFTSRTSCRSGCKPDPS